MVKLQIRLIDDPHESPKHCGAGVHRHDRNPRVRQPLRDVPWLAFVVDTARVVNPIHTGPTSHPGAVNEAGIQIKVFLLVHHVEHIRFRVANKRQVFPREPFRVQQRAVRIRRGVERSGSFPRIQFFVIRFVDDVAILFLPDRLPVLHILRGFHIGPVIVDVVLNVIRFFGEAMRVQVT